MFKKSIALLFPTLVLTTGCSMTGMAYRHSDDLIVMMIDEEIALSRTQKERLSTLLTEAREQHRYHELPKYVTFLNRVKSGVQKGVDYNQAAELSNQSEQLFKSLANLLIDALSPVAVTLTDEQINKIEQKFLSYEKKAVEKEAGTAVKDPLEHQTEELASTYVYWAGKLTDEQIATIKSTARKLPDTSEYEKSRARENRREFLKLLRSEMGGEQLAATIKHRLFDTDDTDPEYIKLQKQREHLLIELSVQITDSLTDKQKKRTIKKIDKWIKEIEALYPDDLKQAV